MKYFELGARTLRQELLGEGEKADRHVSVFERLEWQSPATPTVEVAEGIFQTSTIAEKNTAFQELFLFSIRHFPFLCDQSPLQDVRGEGFTASRSDLHCLHLYARARHLGFKSIKIDEMVSRLSDLPPLVIDPVPTSRRATTWRCGKPSISTFFELRSVAFIPTLDAMNTTTTLTPGFVLKSFMDAFFGEAEYMLEMADPPDEIRSPSRDRPMASPGPPLSSFHWDTIQVDLQPSRLDLRNISQTSGGRLRKRANRGGKTKTGPTNHRAQVMAQDIPALQELDLQVPDRLATRSSVSIPTPRDQVPADPIENAARLSPAENVSHSGFRPGIALPRHDPPEPVAFIEPDLFTVREGTGVGVKSKNYLAKTSKERRRLGKLRRQPPRERLSSAGAQSKSNLAKFTFRPRKKPASSPSAPERTETSPIFHLEEKTISTNKLKRKHGYSLAEGLQVDIRPSQTLSQRKRRRFRGPLVKAGTKRTASQNRGDWFTAIRRQSGQGTRSRPKLSPELDDGHVSTTSEQDVEVFSGRGEASPLRVLNQEQDRGAGVTKRARKQIAVAQVRRAHIGNLKHEPEKRTLQQGESSSSVLQRDNEPAPRATSINKAVERRSPINELDGFAETMMDFLVNAEWATDTEIPDSDRERSAPASPGSSEL
ncbi:hypothetical protein F5Y08DRAFT_355682 [Xylaria arbuscula]|nr:hypothetical protein F5Y08DRAFT_355682 [Xylaria arbuscula]